MTYTTETLEQVCDRIVKQEVLVCVSGLVSALASGAYGIESKGLRYLSDLCKQAAELSCPIPDYEYAARDAGWDRDKDQPEWWTHTNHDGACSSAQEVCETFDLEPYDREVFEHWAVTDWMADKLEAQGEKVDTGFQGLNVWARTTTGQMISMDYVIQKIAEGVTK